MGEKPQIKFLFDEKKAAQAAAFLIGRHGGNLTLFRLIKLLYLADRHALLESGMTITGDRMFSMDKGPMLSKIYDIIKRGLPDEHRDWFGLIAPPINHVLSLVESVSPTDELSDYEIEVLTAVDRRFGRMDVRLLIEYLHSLGEWEDPQGSSRPIAPERILEVEHQSINRIRRVAQEAEDLWKLSSVVQDSA